LKSYFSVSVVMAMTMIRVAMIALLHHQHSVADCRPQQHAMYQETQSVPETLEASAQAADVMTTV